MRKFMCVAAVLALFASGALAVDIQNKDSKKYDLKIESGASTTSTSIEGNTTKANACTECSVEVVGAGKVDAKGDDVVLIKDGAVTVEAK